METGAVVVGGGTVCVGAVVSVGWVTGGTAVQPAISNIVSTVDRKRVRFFIVVTLSFVGGMVNGGGHC